MDGHPLCLYATFSFSPASPDLKELIGLRALIPLLVALVLSGCGGHAEEGPAYEPLVARIHQAANGQPAPSYKEIRDPKTANALYAALSLSDESNAIVSMARNPDYVVEIVNASPTASAEPRTYSIWASRGKRTVEVVSHDRGGYIQLNEKLSATIKAAL